MTRLHAIVATAGLGFLCAGCAGGQSTSPESGADASSAQTTTYKCEGCAKTTTVAAGAPAPSC